MISQSESVTVTVPSFLAKLWDIVNNTSFKDIVCWNHDGTTIIIKDKDAFSLEILPMYFKHCNFSSFIRQLNKYGFKKTYSPPRKRWLEFFHPYFCLNDPCSITKVKRQPSVKLDTAESNEVQLQDLFDKVQNLKKSQDDFENKMKSISDDSNELWTKTVELKKKQKIQQKIICNIMAFLADLISQNDDDINNISLLLANKHKEQKNYTNMIGMTDRPLMIKSKGDLLLDLGDNDNISNSVNMPSSNSMNRVGDSASSQVMNYLLSENGKIYTNIIDDMITDENMSGLSDDDSSISDDILSMTAAESSAQLQPFLNISTSEDSLTEVTPLSKSYSGMKLNVDPVLNDNLTESCALIDQDSVMNIDNLGNSKHGSNVVIIKVPGNSNMSENDLLLKSPDGSDSKVLPVDLPSDNGNQMFHKPANSIVTHLNSPKELGHDFGSNEADLQIPENTNVSANELLLEIPELSGGSELSIDLPAEVENKELGEHVTSMDEQLSSLKELMSDTDLNLDLNEVQDLFSTDEINSLFLPTDDLVLLADNSGEEYSLFPPQEKHADSNEIHRSPARINKFS